MYIASYIQNIANKNAIRQPYAKIPSKRTIQLHLLSISKNIIIVIQQT